MHHDLSKNEMCQQGNDRKEDEPEGADARARNRDRIWQSKDPSANDRTEKRGGGTMPPLSVMVMDPNAFFHWLYCIIGSFPVCFPRSLEEVLSMKKRAYPTLLCAGIGGGSLSLLPARRRLRKAGIYAKCLPLPPILTGSTGHYAKIARAAILRLADKAGRPVNVIPWSLGGIYVARAMRDPEVAACVRRIVVFGTPYDGTVAGHAGFLFGLSFLKGARDVLPGSRALEEARELINDTSRTWQIFIINGKLDPLAPFPQRSVDPDRALTGPWTHLAPFTNSCLQRLFVKLIKQY